MSQKRFNLRISTRLMIGMHHAQLSQTRDINKSGLIGRAIPSNSVLGKVTLKVGIMLATIATLVTGRLGQTGSSRKQNSRRSMSALLKIAGKGTSACVC